MGTGDLGVSDFRSLSSKTIFMNPSIERNPSMGRFKELPYFTAKMNM